MAWKIDPAHSQIQFSVRHMMISNVRGRFENFTGNVEFDEEDPLRSSVEVQIEAASINTREPQRDGHLKSPDFLDAEKHPYLYFKSKRMEKINDSHGRIIGDLTIRDIPREVVLDVEYAGQAKSPWGTTSAGFSATTRINREDWGLKWNQLLETGGVLVGDRVNISIELEIIRQAEAQSETVPAAEAAKH
ncbi:MAG: YceI family protein [Actinobacteria bacterium]|nr:YceI family protein [Actinomycetota bacterium]